MSNDAKNEILAAIENINVKIDVMQEQVAKIPEIQKEVEKIPDMQQDIRNISRSVTTIEQEKIPKIQKEIEKIPKMQQDIRSISRSVAVIEHEHGDKLRALFDAFAVDTEKIETQEERISFCEKKLENHDIEIDYLTNKVQGL